MHRRGTGGCRGTADTRARRSERRGARAEVLRTRGLLLLNHPCSACVHPPAAERQGIRHAEQENIAIRAQVPVAQMLLLPGGNAPIHVPSAGP